jgi:hypothetical protein
MGPTFLPLTLKEMGECAFLPHLIHFRYGGHKKAHLLVQNAAENHDYWLNAL